jgi:succinyl-CoA synthetase beta subunit
VSWSGSRGSYRVKASNEKAGFTALISRVHALRLVQGAQIMSTFGVNVPPGIPIFSVEEALPAAEKMAGPDGEV